MCYFEFDTHLTKEELTIEMQTHICLCQFNGCHVAVCLLQVWAAIPPWKQGSLAEFVVLSANEVYFINVVGATANLSP